MNWLSLFVQPLTLAAIALPFVACVIATRVKSSRSKTTNTMIIVVAFAVFVVGEYGHYVTWGNPLVYEIPRAIYAAILLGVASCQFIALGVTAWLVEGRLMGTTG